MTSPSGCSSANVAAASTLGNNSAPPVVAPPTLLKLSPNSIDLGYHTMVRTL